MSLQPGVVVAAAENARAGILQKASGGGMGWGHSRDPVLERMSRMGGTAVGERWGRTPLALNLLYAAEGWVPFFCGESSALGRHGTPSAWDAGMLTMETHGLFLPGSGIRSESRFILVFRPVSASVLLQLNLIWEVLRLESAAQDA